MAEGLAIDLHSPAPVGDQARHLHPGDDRADVWGQGHALPTSITNPRGLGLTPCLTRRSVTTLKLRDSSKAFRFVMLWISNAAGTSSEPPQPQAT